jgi:hypothetical protein
MLSQLQLLFGVNDLVGQGVLFNFVPAALLLTPILHDSTESNLLITNRAFGRFRLPKYLRHQMQTPKSSPHQIHSIEA